ncbi:hypothetical protein H257_09727 [Aphanomyces astaci]|uniref:Uncharacterized protein n=1 Tax=Aphanomyces astaci TaxID=112090 RepID=W4G959_APHAT|nr:hypothetical protein H257_09727 [Aphanomyces astaci]ETV76232.1 hypothetical protein H257_09727 [Aphanomyces astaci]|eukprot:XP_009834357.1 hypothetical protein H257_09727 [Aphanomyces astaci]
MVHANHCSGHHTTDNNQLSVTPSIVMSIVFGGKAIGSTTMVAFCNPTLDHTDGRRARKNAAMQSPPPEDATPHTLHWQLLVP